MSTGLFHAVFIKNLSPAVSFGKKAVQKSTYKKRKTSENRQIERIKT
jgi:hypothetical protein